MWPHLTGLLRRSRPPLTSLDLDVDFLSEFDLVGALSYIPGLESLRLAVFDIAASGLFWYALTMEDGSIADGLPHSLCPNLRTLDLTRFSRCSIPAVTEMVLSRCSLTAGVDSIFRPLDLLVLSGDLQAEDAVDMLRFPGISLCMDEGLEIKLQTWPQN